MEIQLVQFYLNLTSDECFVREGFNQVLILYFIKWRQNTVET